MNNVQNDAQPNRYHSPAFWAWHPVGRGVGAGTVTSLLTATTPFSSGFIYGGVSGLANIAFRPIYKKIDEKTISSEAKGLNYLFSVTMPWVASAGFMRQAYKTTGNALFRINPTLALGTALAVECFAYVNRDLLRNETNRHE